MSLWAGFDEVVAIDDAGSFVGGAKLVGISPAQMSRVIARLEERLNTQLFIRTTRRLSLTDTGRAFVDQCRNILQERDELVAQVAGSGLPQGVLRMTCSIALGERFVAPLLGSFIQSHPKISMTLDLTNRVVDIVGEGYDIGIRTGDVTDGRVVTRCIATRAIELCAAPNYLENAGTPKMIDDLAHHACLIGTTADWQFVEKGSPRKYTPSGRFRCNSGTAIVDAAIAGMGICQVPRFYVKDAISRGLLVSVLGAYRASPEPVWIVYPHRRHLQPKVRNVVEFLARDLQQALDAARS